MNILETLTNLACDHWQLLTAALSILATAIHTFRRRPRASVARACHFNDSELLSPPLTRPAYSDRMAYVLAEMSDLAYYQFEGQVGLVEDAVLKARSLNLSTDKSVRKFLNDFSTELMGGRTLNSNHFTDVLKASGFKLLGLIHVAETQGFICKRAVANDPPYLVLAFRGTEKKISDWLTNAHCIPTTADNGKVHTGFFKALKEDKNNDGKTAIQVVEEILDSANAKDDQGRRFPLFITGHSLGGALALLATKLIVPDINSACYTFGAPRVANYEYFNGVKTPVYRVVNSADVVPRVPPGALMEVLVDILKGLAWLTGFMPPISALFRKAETWLDKLSGYRHFGDLRYLTDVAARRFTEVHLLTNPPAMDRIRWAWRRIGYSLRVPVKSHSMSIYRQKLLYLARSRTRHTDG